MNSNAFITGCAPESLGSAFLAESYSRGFSSFAHFRSRPPCPQHLCSQSIQSPLDSPESVQSLVSRIRSSVADLSLLVLAHGGYTSQADVDIRFSDLTSRLMIAQGLLDLLTPEAPIVIIGSNHGRPYFDGFSDLLPRQREYAKIYREIHHLPASFEIDPLLKERLVIPIVGGAHTTRLESIAHQLGCPVDSLSKTTPEIVAKTTLEAALNHGYRGLLELS